MDEIIVFHRLSKGDLRAIAQKLLTAVSGRMERVGVHLTVDEAAVEALVSCSFDPLYGARPLRRAIRTAIEDPAAELMLSGALSAGDTAFAQTKNGKIVLTPQKEHGTIAPVSFGKQE